MDKVFIEGSITGHASPKWKNPGKKDKNELNKQLSIERTNEVESFVQEIFRRNLSAQGIDIEFAIACTKERDFNSISIPAMGVGDLATLEEGGSNEQANEATMRRVDINIALTYQIEDEAGTSIDIVIPEECTDNATNKWTIRLQMSGGAGHAGVGGAFALGQIKNRKTGQVALGSFVGGGIGVGLQSPGADPGWGDWENFTTDQSITFEHLDGTLARLTTAGAGFLIGYSLAYISFPMYGANSISVGGFNLGSVGADAGSNVGQWNFNGIPPGAPCIPEQHIPSVEMIPYAYDIQDALAHQVFFDTASSTISDLELEKLEEFISEITNRI